MKSTERTAFWDSDQGRLGASAAVVALVLGLAFAIPPSNRAVTRPAAAAGNSKVIPAKASAATDAPAEKVASEEPGNKGAATYDDTPKPEPPSRPTAESVKARLEQAQAESLAALESRVKEAEGYFAQRRRGTLAFAKEVIDSVNGDFASGMLGASADMLGTALKQLTGGGKVGHPDDGVYDRLAARYAGRFERHVVDRGRMYKEVDAIAEAYLGDLRAIEARLLVDLRIDDELPLYVYLPRSRLFGPPASDFERLMTPVVRVADDAFAMGIFQFAGSLAVGAIIDRTLVPSGTPLAGKFAIDLAGGEATDLAIEEIIKISGRDPVAKVVAQAAAVSDNLRSLIIDGDGLAGRKYGDLSRLRDQATHPAVERACKEALRKIEASPALGLRGRLQLIHNRRIDERRTAVARSLKLLTTELGEKPQPGKRPQPYVPKLYQLDFEPVANNQTVMVTREYQAPEPPVSAEEARVIHFANTIRDYFGGL